MILWKLILTGIFSMNMGQNMQFNELVLHQDIEFQGSVAFTTRGFTSKEQCETQLAATPNSFTYSKMIITVQSKGCFEDRGPVS